MNSKNIVWRDSDTPVSTHFDDVYFNDDGAIAETLYVFIDGNQLNQRFLTHTKEVFTIGETGFGSGLNFLMTWQQFLQFRQQNPNHILKQLQFFSIEKYPLLAEEMQAIHQKILVDPLLLNLAQQLQHHWPAQEIQFNTVQLNILFADIALFSPHLLANQVTVDAWFFDGFSPAKNSEMWSSELFHELYPLTANNGTFATFTAAGYVKRNLIDAGFTVNKRVGYGKKREMLIGHKNT